MDVNRRIGQLRNYDYDMLMVLLEAQVRKVRNLTPNSTREEDTQEILCILTAAMPLKNGAIEVDDPEVAAYLHELLYHFKRQESKALYQLKKQEFPQKETKVVSIWEES